MTPDAPGPARPRLILSATAVVAAVSLVPLGGAHARSGAAALDETFDRWIVSVDPNARLAAATLDDVGDIDGVDVVMEIDDGIEVIETEALTIDEVEQLVDEPELCIEPDYPAQLTSVVPDDTLFSLQWGLSNPDAEFDIGLEQRQASALPSRRVEVHGVVLQYGAIDPEPRQPAALARGCAPM